MWLSTSGWPGHVLRRFADRSRPHAVTPLLPSHHALIDAASTAIRNRYRPGRHVVGAALLTRSGRLFTGAHLEKGIGRAAVCAEAIALGRAATEAGETDIEAIAAVYHHKAGASDREPAVVAPCGLCREMTADYAPSALVLVPDGAGVAPVPIGDLLPHKFARP